MIELHVEPRVVKTWEAFCAENPPFSIALDGYVNGPPLFSPDGPHANFDHHSGVDRLATRSTCMQVFMALTVGLLHSFQKDGEPHAHVFVNDPDQDTSLSVWQLRNPELIREMHIHKPLARLLLVEDILDCTGGAFPVDPERIGVREQAWVFEPYFKARAAGRLHRMDATEMEAVIDAVGERITAHALGEGKAADLDTRYEDIGGGGTWRIIREEGLHARTGLFAAGVHAFVSARDNEDGTWTYSLGRMSPFVRFPVDELYGVLNEAEGFEEGKGWGGSNTIGGSPREGGSKLSPEDLERVIEAHLSPTESAPSS